MKKKKILGVLGGMGPAASAQFMAELAQMKVASCDQEHPIVYLLSDPTIPDRSAAIVGDSESPAQQIRDGIEKLVEWGADVIAVPCNTAHYFIDDFKDAIGVALIHIVDVTLDAAEEISPQGAWMLSTDGTLNAGMYQKRAAGKGYMLHVPPAEVQEKNQIVVDFVKAGRMQEAGSTMRTYIESLWRIRDIPIILACTELPLAYAASGLPPEKGISSITALAKASLRAIE